MTDLLVLEGKTVFLKPLQVSDVSEEYLSWLKDPEVTRFLEVRWHEQTLDSVRAYVAGFDQKNKFLWGIYDRASRKHIGNISIYDLNWNHRFCNYGYLIGDKDFWGKSAAFEAVALIFDFIFLKLELNSLSTGAYANNLASVFNYRKVGLTFQGAKKERLRSGDQYVDEVDYGITKAEWLKHREKISFKEK